VAECGDANCQAVVRQPNLPGRGRSHRRSASLSRILVPYKGLWFKQKWRQRNQRCRNASREQVTDQH
jgi:hypothetical protein